MRRYIISVLMENKSGALSRVVGLFSARGYNIDSLCVSTTEDNTLSRLTIVTNGNEFIIEQMTKQLNKLIEVVKVINLNKSKFIDRELLLLKILVSRNNKDFILNLVNVYRAKIVDVSLKSYTLELTGSKGEIDSFIDIIDKDFIVEVVRSGSLGIGKGENVLKV